MWLQWAIVSAVGVVSAGLLAQRLVPLSWRITLAHKLNGKVPDRLRIWWVGRVGCGDCAPKH